MSRPVASATKLMTAYVAMERLPLSRIVRAAPYSALPGESLMGLRAGQRVSVRDLLYGLILESGNDAAYTLAVATSGSEPRFVREMNLRASALGLADTRFANPIGLDEPGNYSSARDLVALTRRLLQRRAFRQIAAAKEAELRSLRPPIEVDTRNTLLHRVPWATGVKTGHTFGAGYVLVASARRAGVELVSAVLGAGDETSRDLESIELLEHGFSLYRERRPVRRGQILARPAIRYQDAGLPLRAARPVTVGVRRDQRLEVSVRAPDEVEGPIRRNRRLGTVVVAVDGRRVALVPLLAARPVEAAAPLEKARGVAEDNLALIGFALCVILVIAILAARVRRRGSEGEGSAALADQTRIERARRRDERERRRRERDEADR